MKANELIIMLENISDQSKALILMSLCETMGDIGSFKASKNDLKRNLEQFYEIEYKHSMLNNRPFEGLPKRKENLIKFLEKNADKVIKAIADQLIPIYSKWLRAHAITEPREWAKARIDIAKEFSLQDKEIFVAIDGEYQRYAGAAITYDDLDPTKSRGLQMLLDNLRRDFVEDNQMLADDFEESDLQPALDELEELQDRLKDAIEESDDDEIESLKRDIDEKELEINDIKEDYQVMLDDIENIREMSHSDLLDYIVSNYLSDSYLNTFLEEYGYRYATSSQLDDIFLHLYENVVFPEWFAYWKPKGIAHTRKRIEKAEKDLKKLKSQGFSNKGSFGKTNELINVTHQTGKMIDYVNEVYDDVDERLLNELSNLDTTLFDKDLKKVGVQL